MPSLEIDHLLDAVEPHEGIIALDTYICELCDYGDNLEALTVPQRTFFFNQSLEREVNNGGLDQFFANSSGDYAHATLKAMQVIGAVKTATILEAAIAQFPNGEVPADQADRITLMESFDESVAEKWEALTQRFLAYEEDLNTLNLAYVRQYKSDFQ